MPKILRIDSCASLLKGHPDCGYYSMLVRNCKHPKTKNKSVYNPYGEIPSWCPLEDEDNKIRAEWFKKGQMSVKRKNKSGCTCIIDEDDGDRITSVCGAHKAWMEEQCQKN